MFHFSSKIFSNRFKSFITVLKDRDRKPILKMLSDIAHIALVYKCIPYHYVSRYLFKKNCENVIDYLPNKFLYNIKRKFNNQEVIYYLDNKLFFNFFYNPFGISTPKVLMFNDFKNFKIGHKNIEINNSIDFKDVLVKLLITYEPEGTIFIKKTYGSGSGANIFKVSAKILDEPGFVEKLYMKVVKSGYLFQETIKQHPHMSKLNSSSLNTLRLDTFIDNSGNIEVMSGHVRMSIKNLPVDNMGAGGCAVSIDMSTGRLKKNGYSVIKFGHCKLYTEHPITKTTFLDFELPYFEEAKSLVIKAASLMPGLRLVGWDVGISDAGPILIEGNYDYDIPGSDFLYGGYHTNQVFRKVLNEIHYKL